MTLYWPDVSNNNWHNTAEAVAFVNALPGEGFAAVCHKVSEGDYYRDPYWSAVRVAAEAIGLPVIGYHYVTTGDPHAQAATYIAHVGMPGVPCMLDFEANSGDIGNFWQVVNAFNAAGVQVALSYLPRWYWQQIGSPSLAGVPGLVSSSYFGVGDYASALYIDAGGDSGPGWQSYGGATPAVWQFTDGALIAGDSVDCNAFEGSAADLAVLLGTPAPASNGDPTMPDTTVSPDVLAVAQDNQTQLRGPDLAGWPQLAGHTVVDALALVGAKLGIDGFGLVTE